MSIRIFWFLNRSNSFCVSAAQNIIVLITQLYFPQLRTRVFTTYSKLEHYLSSALHRNSYTFIRICNMYCVILNFATYASCLCKWCYSMDHPMQSIYISFWFGLWVCVLHGVQELEYTMSPHTTCSIVCKAHPEPNGFTSLSHSFYVSNLRLSSHLLSKHWLISDYSI